MAYIDTNVFLYVIDANSKKDFRDTSKRILKRVEEGQGASISVLTLMEVLWWCEKHAKTMVIDVYNMMLSFENIKILSLASSIIDDAMFFKGKYKLELNDCVSAAIMAASDITEIYSNDKGFDKIEWIKRIFE